MVQATPSAVRFYLQTRSMPSSVIHFRFEILEIYGGPKKMASLFRDVQSCVQANLPQTDSLASPSVSRPAPTVLQATTTAAQRTT